MEQNARNAMLSHLHGQAFLPSVVHGDFQQGNILVDSSVHAYLIDWETYSVGDSALDIVHYLMRIEQPISGVHQHAKALPLFSSSDLSRAQLYLVYERALEFVAKSKNDRPWDNPKRREQELQALYQHIEADKRWLDTVKSFKSIL